MRSAATGRIRGFVERSLALMPATAGAVAVAAIAAGCSTGTIASTGPSVRPASTLVAATVTATPAPPAASTSAAPASPTAAASAPDQIDTSWGRIWVSTPPSFPVYPGLEPGAAAGTPASTSLVIPGDRALAIETWYGSHLPAAGFVVDSTSGPAEDGGYVIDAHGDPAGCKAHTQVRPLGTMTFVTVMFGAACPFH